MRGIFDTTCNNIFSFFGSISSVLSGLKRVASPCFFALLVAACALAPQSVIYVRVSSLFV